jgi:hypothetical protein
MIKMLQAQFHAVARALADEIERAVATGESELNIHAHTSDLDEERLLNSLPGVRVRPEVGRLISHLHEIGVELRARACYAL